MKFASDDLKGFRENHGVSNEEGTRMTPRKCPECGSNQIENIGEDLEPLFVCVDCGWTGHL